MGCKEYPAQHTRGKVVASVYDRHLYLSDITSLVTEDMSPMDSLTTVEAYLDKWLREQVVIVEAEKYIADDIKLDRLVDDYRSSLLSHNYEKRLIEDRLDTVITKEDYQRVYDIQAEQMPLNEAVATMIYFAIPATTRRLDLFLSDWRAGRKEKANKYIAKYAEQYVADTTVYKPVSSLLSSLPDGFKNKTLKAGGKYIVNDGGLEHFLHVVSLYKRGDRPPLSYIKETLRKRILNDRKQALTQAVRDNLYQIALDNNKVKRHIVSTETE